MRDLKHLIYFESLLENADNDLVKQAQAEGKLAIGYTCYHMPEPLLNLPGCFSVRLRAPRTGSLDIATYYMSNYTCEYARALVERGMEGGYQFLDALAGVDACSMMNRAMEHFEILQMNDKPNFFVTHCDIPYKVTDYTLDSYVKQMRRRVLDPLTEKYGVDTSDEVLRKAIEEHNELCRIMQAIGDFRKLDVPTITGYEYHVINLVTLACPKYLIIDKLRETLEELKTREPDARPQYRCKVLLAGSENDDPDFTKLIESCGALVVADRYCYGGMESRLPIEIREGETPIKEDNYLRPGNIYAATKVCQNMIASIYTQAYDMQLMMVRAFNHIGPCQSPIFVISDFCKQVAEIEAGKKEPVMYVGNLAAKRDFTDVRDVVRAYALLVQSGTAGETYNVGSGHAHEIREILDLIISLSTKEIRVEIDLNKIRPVDVPIIEADITKLNAATGWKPQIPLEQTIQEILDYWRERV